MHGGYQVGLLCTCDAVFALRPTDVLFVIATAGWITGQSYMIASALLTRTPSVVLEGSVCPRIDCTRLHADARIHVRESGCTTIYVLRPACNQTRHDPARGGRV